MRTRTYDFVDSILTVGICPESMEEDTDYEFMMDLNRTDYTDYFSKDPDHLNWIGIRKSADDFPFWIVSASQRGNHTYFVEQTATSYKQWSKLTANANIIGKNGKLDPKLVQSYIASVHTNENFLPLPNEPSVVEQLLSIDVIRTDFMKELNIGIAYREVNQNFRDQIFANKTPDSLQYKRFLDIMGIPEGVKNPKNGSITTSWKDREVSWFLATEFENEDQRKYIGNCLVLIIFNDSDEPIDPIGLELGKVTCFVCVVTPQQDGFKLGFYFQFNIPSKQLKSENPKEELSSIVENISVKPHTPFNFLFGESNLRDFMHSKLHNGLAVSCLYHPTLRNISFKPLAYIFEEMGKKYFGNVSSKKKGFQK
eukprot:TRINITY_DN5866_c0_g1_i5.p1 TRINITY_DN5866_c0_g1~~TRINITY_DN5866_c0_g1_i5.p1  ORF type:complete len:368 (+),score=52.08 TRINITY_DN5866_c0_g1_i5:125-1228(+)